MLLRRSILLTVTLLAVSQTDSQETDESAQDDEYSQYFNAAQAYAESVHRPVIHFGSEGQASQPQPHYAPAEHFASANTPLKSFFDTVHEQTRYRRSDNNKRNDKPSIVIRIENPREKNKRSNDDDEDVPSFDYAKSIERDSEETRKQAEVGSEKYRPSASDESFNYEEDSPSDSGPKYRDETRQPYNAEYERAVQDIQSSGSEHIPEEIKTSECRPIQSPKHKPDMNCFVCEDPGSKSKFTQCSYAQKHDPVKYYKENTEKFHMDHLPPGAGAALEKRNKRYADKGQDPYDLIRQRTHKSFEEAGHGTIGDYGFEYEPETYEESKGELSYSEMQAEKIKKNPDNCQKVDREGMTCTVCKDKSTGGNYESCSYTSTPTEKKYAYVKEKKYDSDQPEEEKEQPKEKTVEVSEESKVQSQKVASTEKPRVQRRQPSRQRDVEKVEEKHRSYQSKNPKKRQNLEATQTQAGINTPQDTKPEKQQETQTVSYEEAKKSDNPQQPEQTQNTPENDFHSHDHEHKEHFLNPHNSNEAHQPHFHMHHKSDPFGHQHDHQHEHQHEDQQQQKQPQGQPKPEATQSGHYAEVHRKEDQTVTYDIPKHFSETIRHGGTADEEHQPHDHKHDEDDHHHGAESKEKQEEATAGGGGGNDFDTYHYKLFPEIAKEEKKSKEREEEYEKDYTHIPAATKQNVEDVLAEFSKKDRSKCKKAQKNGMTCYLCVDKNNIQHEECMYVQESQPKSSHLAYHGVKKKSPEEIEKEKQKQEQEKQRQQEDGEDYNENGDQQQDKSAEASAPQPQTAASETHETVVRYNPKFAHIAAEPQMEAAASVVHETVVGYDRETGEPIMGQIDLDQAPRGAEDTVVRYDEETGEPRLVPAEEDKQQQRVRYDEETGEKIPAGKVKKRRKVPKKATEGKSDEQGSQGAASNQAKGNEPPKEEAAQQDANTEPTLKTPPEFTVANEEGAFSAETKPVFSRIYGTKLPRYMIDKTDFELEFDNFSGQSR